MKNYQISKKISNTQLRSMNISKEDLVKRCINTLIDNIPIDKLELLFNVQVNDNESYMKLAQQARDIHHHIDYRYYINKAHECKGRDFSEIKANIKL